MVNGKIITAVPAVKQSATLYFLEKGTNQFELSLADDNGVLRTLFTGSGGGGGGTTPPIKDVLTAGNDLDGKHFEGVLKSIDADVPNNVSSTFSSDKDKVSYSRTTNDVNTTFGVDSTRVSYRNSNTSLNVDTNFDVSPSGINFSNQDQSTNENLTFAADHSLRYNRNTFNSEVNLDVNDFSLKYGISDRMMPGNDMEFIVEKERATYSIPYRDPMNPMAPPMQLRYEVGAEGIKADKYLKPTQDEQYVQKKYVDGLLGGGKPEVTIDNMYLTYGGWLALHVTIKNMDLTTINSPEPYKFSSLQMFTYTTGSSNMAETFNLDGNDARVRNIREIYKDVDSGVYKVHLEINPTPLIGWSGATKYDNLFRTGGEFRYSNDSQGTIRAKSRPTHYAELYKKDQAGVVSFVPSGGPNKGVIIPSSSEIDYFRTEHQTFNTESVFDISYNNYSLEYAGGGAPLGSLEYTGTYEPFTANGRVMSNPTPGQVTDWELTIGLSGNNIDAIDTQNYAAVICDSDDNVLDSKPIFPFTGGLTPAHPHDIKVTLRTINTFKNIIGNDRGFRLGIRTSAASSGLDTKFELKSFRRISHSLA